MIITVQTPLRTIRVDAQPSWLVSDLLLELSKHKDCGADGLRLIHGGHQLKPNKSLSDYTIHEGSTIQCIRTQSTIQPPPAPPTNPPLNPTLNPTPQGAEKWKELGSRFDFDTDLHIVDPEAHHSLLASLERSVIEKSEAFRCKGVYDTNDNTYERHEIPEGTLRVLKRLPDSLDENKDSKALFSIAKSYVILSQVLCSFRYVIDHGFATSFFSFFLEDPECCLAKLVQVPLEALQMFHQGLEETLTHESILSPKPIHRAEDFVWRLHTALGLGLGLSPREPLLSDEICMLCRVVVLLLDLALVSYMGSHGSDFDVQYLGKHDKDIQVGGNVLSTKTTYGFRLSCRRLACLDGFLDRTSVWIFRQIHEHGPRVLDDSKPLPILTTMETFADVWGPVWTEPVEGSTSGEILRYHVSKGVIHRVETDTLPRYDGAATCHWESWPEYHYRRVTRGIKDVFRNDAKAPTTLKWDDMLLIGSLLEQHESCRYSPSDFQHDSNSAFYVLGTKPSTWTTDSRSFAVSFSKLVGLAMSGTQKKLPATTVKQHIWDKWSKNPTRANPWILHMSLGVEVSQCTGNARRVPLKDILLCDALQPRLELCVPGWREKIWGPSLLVALHSQDDEDICQFWKDYEAHRQEVAELVCCMLDLLNETGKLNGVFNVAFFNYHAEHSLHLSLALNSWANILEDSDESAVYAISSNSCLVTAERPVEFGRSVCSQLWEPRMTQHTLLQTELSNYHPTWMEVNLAGHYFRTSPNDPDILVSWRFGIFGNRDTARETTTRYANEANPRRIVVIQVLKKSFGGLKRPRASQRLRSGAQSGSPAPTTAPPNEEGNDDHSAAPLPLQQPWSFQGLDAIKTDDGCAASADVPLSASSSIRRVSLTIDGTHVNRFVEDREANRESQDVAMSSDNEHHSVHAPQPVNHTVGNQVAVENAGDDLSFMPQLESDLVVTLRTVNDVARFREGTHSSPVQQGSAKLEGMSRQGEPGGSRQAARPNVDHPPSGNAVLPRRKRRWCPPFRR
ncbi:hypothetical protein QBC33DRAFT_30359 [Phialemonium atrogriseum]|uniref:Ubiquitin-like domain-containing protein n=1 Tax=Phialemonium atrogriseum TaxID=1093897 RepID=A0AAJ0CCQ4_9PEZI|nr:uncharacterized protein QBC33DRAFT_30359 [Phialemonium atrogriseum]KAK1772804.1 hypothetical protein QBC33DRAFT_30359 [Phialemonium atrogriseum]